MDWRLVQKALTNVEKRIDAVLDIKPGSNSSGSQAQNIVLGDNDWGWDPEFGGMPVHVAQEEQNGGGQPLTAPSLDDVTSAITSSMSMMTGVKKLLQKSETPEPKKDEAESELEREEKMMPPEEPKVALEDAQKTTEPVSDKGTTEVQEVVPPEPEVKQENVVLAEKVAATPPAATAENEKIKSLIEEATYYNKENVRLTTLLKNARQKEDEMKTTLTSLEKKFIENKSATVALQERFDSLSLSEKSLKDALRAQKEKEEQQNSRIFQLETDFSKTKELLEQTKANLDRIYTENTELRAKQDENARQAQSEKLQAEINRNEALVLQCDHIQRQADKQQASLQKEIAELRAALTRAQDDLGWKEDQYQKEIAALNSRLLSATQHNDSISASLHTSTAPLLRQIESLQSQFDNARGSWDALERHLTARSRDLERELEKEKGKEREWEKERNDLEKEKESVQRVLESVRKDTVKLRQSIEEEREKVDKLTKEIETMRANEAKLVHDHHRAMDSLRIETDMRVKEAVERERRILDEKLKAEERRMLDREREMEKQRVRASMMRRMSTESSAVTETSPTLSTSEPNGRNVDVQIMTLQEQLRMAIQARDEIASELVKVSAALASFQPDVLVVKIQEQMEKLQEQHSSALELLGEKTEQVEELKHDIQDMREAYRVQIQELVDKLNRNTTI